MTVCPRAQTVRRHTNRLTYVTDRLTNIAHVKGGSTTVASVDYTLDDVGNRTQRVDQQGTHTYAYDDLYRLTSVTYPGPSTTTYDFDASGNRTEMDVSGNATTYAYDPSRGRTDRITTVTPPGPPRRSPTPGTTRQLTDRGGDEFEWGRDSHEDRMVSATVNSVTTTFAYRGDGLRDSRTVGMATTQFTWDIAGGLPVVLDDGPSREGYVYGAGLAGMKQSRSWFYYLADGLGSTMAIVDASGNSQKSYEYDVYGEVTGGSGSLANEFDFAGQQTDGTGLQYLRARYYDPVTGTFLSREPMASNSGCTLHPFAYGLASPGRLVDPSGQIPIEGGEGGGRSDCAGLWTKIVNTVNAIYDAAETWYNNEYGKWDTGFGSKPGDKMTPESRAAHYQEFDRLQSAYDRQIDDYYAKGSSKQKNPCPPPGGGLWEKMENTITLIKGEYFRGKSLDDAAKHWQGSTSNPSGGWNFHWPKPPDLGNSAQ